MNTDNRNTTPKNKSDLTGVSIQTKLIPEEDKANYQNPTQYLLSLTALPDGEVVLFNTLVTLNKKSPLWHKTTTSLWLDTVKSELKNNIKSQSVLSSRPLVRLIVSLAKNILVPKQDNFTSAKRTPWGGHQIHFLMKNIVEFQTDEIIGEAWIISAHKSFPNKIPVKYNNQILETPLWLIGLFAPVDLYGQGNVDKFCDRPPFLTKLLNSGSWQKYKTELKNIFDSNQEHLVTLDKNILESNNHKLHLFLSGVIENLEINKDTQKLLSRLKKLYQDMLSKNLSVQIHPPSGYKQDEKGRACHSKTEAWVVLDAENGSGLYLGLKKDIDKEQMEVALKNNRDISDWLNFITVKPGDIFFIPSGTPHAIGAGILLMEPQETSETTFRYYDWGRLDEKGAPRELHIKDALAVTNWNTKRGTPFIENTLRRHPVKIKSKSTNLALHENLINENEFSFDRVTFKENMLFDGDASLGLHGVTVVSGQVEILDCNNKLVQNIKKGMSFIVPASFGRYQIRAIKDSTIFITRSDKRIDV